MTITSKLFVSLLLVQATVPNLHAENASQWTLRQLFAAAHNNFTIMKRDSNNYRALNFLSKTFLPHDCADLATLGATEKEIGEIIMALDKVHELGKLKRTFSPIPSAIIPVQDLYHYCYYPECYASKSEYKELFKYKMQYTWREAIQLVFGSTKYINPNNTINIHECAADAARFNAAYASAEQRVYYRNKYNKILFPLIGLVGVVYAISKA